MSVTVTLAPPADTRVLAYKDLVDEVLWGRLVARIVAEEPELGPEQAALIMNEALGFLLTCAKNPGMALGPSPLVDIGWHTLIMYTAEYREFCLRVAGRFIDHSPSDVPGVVYPTGGLGQTVEAMRRLGPVNEMLWAGSDKCSQCNDSPSGCHTKCSFVDG